MSLAETVQESWSCAATCRMPFLRTNGLVLDGGLVVVSHPSHAQVLCLVIGLPLGISRSGVYRGDLNGSLSSALCLPSDA